MSDDSHLPKYIKLGDFEPPAMPTQRAFQILLSKSLLLFKKNKVGNEGAISSDHLGKTSEADLNNVAASPAYGPLLHALNQNLSPYVSDLKSDSKVELIVLPPCDENDIIKTWAKHNKLECLAPPTSQSILSGRADSPVIGSGNTLVIPRLEAWMMRTHSSLNLIRQLLAAIESTERSVVIGCNVYAWEFLKKSVDAASFLPDPMTFDALDCDQLKDWFNTLYSSEKNNYKLFHQQTAQDIFADNDEGNDSYFKELAATSSGIPWVAWHLWRKSLLTNDHKASDEGNDTPLVDDPNQHVLWVTALQEYALPDTKSNLPLLVLQAILIHHEISIDHLVKVLPGIRALAAVSLLKRAGIINQENGMLSCRPAAYPAIRQGLTASGFPVGVV